VPEEAPLTLEDFYLSEEEKLQLSTIERVRLPTQKELSTEEMIPNTQVSLPHPFVSRSALPSLDRFNKDLEMAWARKDSARIIQLWQNIMEDTTVTPNTSSVNYLLRAYEREGMVDEALDLLNQLPEFGLKPTTSIFNSVLSCISRMRPMPQRELAEEVVREMVAATIAPDIHTFNILIDLYCRSNNYAEAVRQLDMISEQASLQPDLRSYSILLDHCYRHRLASQAVALIPRLKQQGLVPSLTMFNQLVALCTLEDAVQMYPTLLEFITPSSPSLGSPASLGSPSEPGDTDSSFDPSLRPSLISGSGAGPKSLKFPKDREADLLLALLSSAGRKGEAGLALFLWDKFVKALPMPSAFSSTASGPHLSNAPRSDSFGMNRREIRLQLGYNALLFAQAKGQQYGPLFETIQKMRAEGLELLPNVKRFIVGELCGSEQGLDQAAHTLRHLLEGVSSPFHLELVKLVLKGYAQSRQLAKMFGLFAEFSRLGLRADLETYNHLLEGCRQVRNLETAVKVFEQIVKVEKMVPDETTIELLVEHHLLLHQTDKTFALLATVLAQNQRQEKKQKTSHQQSSDKDKNEESVAVALPSYDALALLVRKCARIHRDKLPQAFELMHNFGMVPDRDLRLYSETKRLLPPNHIVFAQKINKTGAIPHI